MSPASSLGGGSVGVRLPSCSGTSSEVAVTPASAAALAGEGAGQRGPGRARRPRPPEAVRLCDAAGPPQDWRRRVPEWTPPQSPYGLLQEQLYREPWKVLVACVLLNLTTATAVRRVIWGLFEEWPDPEAASRADPRALAERIRPLGLHRKRAGDLIRMSREFVGTPWVSPRQLHGVGQYASDAYAIFVEGRWREVQPRDKELRKYHAWLAETGGLGTGLQRDAAPGTPGGMAGPPGGMEGLSTGGGQATNQGHS